MKQKKLLVVVVLLLLTIPQLLLAQYNERFSGLKPGDWFEVLVSDTLQSSATSSYRYNVKFLLKEIDTKGTRNYSLTFERTRVIMKESRSPDLGYDSYYPQYKQGLSQPPPKPKFVLKADKNGKIISSEPSNKFSDITLNEIEPRKTYGGTSAEMQPVIPESVRHLAAQVLQGIAQDDANWYSGKTYKDSGLSFQLVGASFPLQSNVLIEGRIGNINQQVRDGLMLYLPGNDSPLQITSDGTFKAAVFLSEAAGAYLIYRYIPNKTLAKSNQNVPEGVDVQIAMEEIKVPLFLQPGDTLYLQADAPRFVESLRFRGDGEDAAAFALALAKASQEKKAGEIPYGVKTFSASTYMQAQHEDQQVFERLLTAHGRKLPANALNYYRLKFAFEQGSDRLDFLIKTKYLSQPDATETFENFPEGFFKGIDSLPVVMADFNSADWYADFLRSFKMYMIDKTSRLTGGNHDFFLGDYVLPLNTFKRYPLYQALAYAFKRQFRSSSWEEAQVIKPYYADFNNNCGDLALTKSVAEQWHALARWAPGKKVPLKSIKRADGGELHLNTFKGKVLSITFNYHYPEQLRRLLPRIKKQDPNKVHFLIVQLKEDGYPVSNVSEELKKLPNVTFVEVARGVAGLEEAVLVEHFDMKTFVLDAEQRIIKDNIDDSPNRLSQDQAFEAAIQKALAPKKISEVDKAELIKAIGWSASSILVAGMVFFGIYRTRISAIKRRELLKRQIKELEIKAIRSQMNPHFMFNALNSIQSLINNHQYKEASVYLEKFSLLMRKVLHNSQKAFISLSDELKAVTLYAELEKLRFDFNFEVRLSEDVNPDLVEIPGMIIQPLVENAILHGIAHKGNKGVLNVIIDKEGLCLRIKVADNGPGLKKTEREPLAEGLGLKLVSERLNLLNSQRKKGQLCISENVPAAEGVTAILTIPVD